MPAEIPGFAKDAPFALIRPTNLQGQYGAYIAEPALVHAANTALGLEMPLLLTGEPGCGKSDFAWVAAKAIGHKEPLRCHIRSDTRARDLLYHYDALIRFGDAQHGDRDLARDPRQYITLRPLGAALMKLGEPRPVVLIDEIDKAPRDLPNDLLHELDEGRFEIPEIGDLPSDKKVFDRTYRDIELSRRMERPAKQPKPLVIITSNAERQLPEPFLRRCVFFHIPPPRLERLGEIARARFPDQNPTLMNDLSAIFFALRSDKNLVKAPTTAEMLNWITALSRLYDRAEVMAAIQPFVAIVKGGGAAMPWGKLPGLGCLLKMNEDFEQVVRRGA